MPRGTEHEPYNRLGPLNKSSLAQPLAQLPEQWDTSQIRSQLLAQFPDVEQVLSDKKP